jgi:hypothetical protein
VKATAGCVCIPKLGVGDLKDVEVVDTKYVEDQAVGTLVDAEGADDINAANLAKSATAANEKAVEALADVKIAEASGQMLVETPTTHLPARLQSCQ